MHFLYKKTSKSPFSSIFGEFFFKIIILEMPLFPFGAIYRGLSAHLVYSSHWNKKIDHSPATPSPHYSTPALEE